MTTNAEGSMDGNGPIVIDMGKQRGKRIKELKRGTGKLTEDLHDALADLKANGAIASSPQVVIVVVERKREVGKMWLPKMMGF